MKFGYSVGDRVNFRVDGKVLAGRIKDMVARVITFVADAGGVFEVRVVNEDTVVVSEVG